MNPFWVVLIIVLGLVYIISPVDLVPDFFPIAGRLDDLGLVALLIYYLKTGRWPAFISRIAGWLFGTGSSGAGKSQNQGRAAGGKQQTAGKKDPYAVLGLSAGASSQEIHEAYRRLAHQYHPDKVSHLGEEFQELARQRFLEIQEAYETLTGKTP
ncbi:MAG: DnaJ domain-containing protein [Desulfosalsimonas sp.]